MLSMSVARPAVKYSVVSHVNADGVRSATSETSTVHTGKRFVSQRENVVYASAQSASRFRPASGPARSCTRPAVWRARSGGARRGRAAARAPERPATAPRVAERRARTARAARWGRTRTPSDRQRDSHTKLHRVDRAMASGDNVKRATRAAATRAAGKDLRLHTPRPVALSSCSRVVRARGHQWWISRAFDLLHSDEPSSAADLRRCSWRRARSRRRRRARRRRRGAAAASRASPCRPPRRARGSRGRPQPAASRPPAVPRSSSGELPQPPAVPRASSGEHAVAGRPRRAARRRPPRRRGRRPRPPRRTPRTAETAAATAASCSLRVPAAGRRRRRGRRRPVHPLLAGRSGCNGWVHSLVRGARRAERGGRGGGRARGQGGRGLVQRRCAAAGFVAVSASKAAPRARPRAAGGAAAAGDDGAPPRPAKRAASAAPAKNHRGNC